MILDDDKKKKLRGPSRNPFRRRPRLLYALLFLFVYVVYASRHVLYDLWVFNEDACPAIRRQPATKKICFVTSVFGEKLRGADRPSNVQDMLDCSRYRFFFYTNLWRLKAPGWTKILQYDYFFHYSRMITRSRWPKFRAWQDARILKECKVVYYMDGYVRPRLEQAQQLEQIAHDLAAPHSPGLAQVLHPSFDGQSLEEVFHGILERHKDLPEHTNATFKWLQAQPDFKPILPYYLNKYFAYNPNSPTFQRLSDFFWDQYGSETGSWRDQPMWAYTLHHFNVTPLVLTREGDIEKGGNLFQHGGDMGWGGHVYKKKAPK